MGQYVFCYNGVMEKIATDIYTFAELRKDGYTPSTGC